MSFAEEVYPNSPLIEVVFEIRFPGEMAIECRRHEFWDLVRDVYPRILIPTVRPGTAIPLEPYRFEREDGKAGIMTAMNRLAMYTRAYQGFRAFKAEFLRIHALFGKCFHVDRLNRAGWRYVNVIPFAREDGLVPLKQFLNIGLRLPPIVPERFRALSLAFSAGTDGGSVTTKLDQLTDPRSQQEALLLDFDYGKEAELRFADVEAYMNEAHDYTRSLFEQMITADYRRYLRGEAV